MGAICVLRLRSLATWHRICALFSTPATLRIDASCRMEDVQMGTTLCRLLFVFLCSLIAAPADLFGQAGWH